MSDDHPITEVLFTSDDDSGRCATCLRPVKVAARPTYQYIGPDDKGVPVYRFTGAELEHDHD